jgi:hypothetical protein
VTGKSFQRAVKLGWIIDNGGVPTITSRFQAVSYSKCRKIDVRQAQSQNHEIELGACAHATWAYSFPNFVRLNNEKSCPNDQLVVADGGCVGSDKL